MCEQVWLLFEREHLLQRDVYFENNKHTMRPEITTKNIYGEE